MNWVFLDLKIPFLSADKLSQKGRMEINCSFSVPFKYELNKNVYMFMWWSLKLWRCGYQGVKSFFYMHPWFLVRHLINLFISHFSFYWHQGNHYISYRFFTNKNIECISNLDILMTLILWDKVGNNCGSIVLYWIWNISIFKWQ